MNDVLIVGGGIVGLAIAHRAVQRGLEPLVIDAGETAAASVAAGMLAPVTEAEFGEDALVRLGLDSLQRYPAFCAELGVELRETGTLVVARDQDDADTLDRLHRFRQGLGLDAERLLPTAARRREGALAPSVRLALEVASDRSVDPRALLRALRERVTVRSGRAVSLDARSVTLDDGETLRADQVVLAAGAWSAALADVPVRPVKGQVLRLRDPRGPGLVERTIRTLDAYLVPRADGAYVLGATVEDRGWDSAPTAGGVFELLRDMSEVVPGVLELELEEVCVGFRPATPDNAPIIARLDNGVIAATGHWRNGVLLAPVTADMTVDLLAGVPA
ncbi:MAG: glycine oxidase ThiO [Solirubrobacteraceae bacterium]